MLFSLAISVLLFSVVYFKLLVPFYYWKNRGIFYISPWSRFLKVFLSKKSFALAVRDSYADFPDKPYYGSYQFLRPSLLVRDIELIKRITIKDFDHFTDHSAIVGNQQTDPIVSLNLFSLTGQRWREMRTTLSPAFTASKMKQMFNLMLDTAQQFTEHFARKSAAVADSTGVKGLEMKEVFGKYTNDVIANCAFGIKCDSLGDEGNEFFRMGRDISTPTVARLVRGLLYGFFPKVFEFFRIPALNSSIADFFLKIIKDSIEVRERDRIVRPDMVHLLLEARKGRLLNEYSDDVVKDDAAGFATVQEVPSMDKDKDVKNREKSNYAIELTDEVITAQAVVFFIAGFTTSSSVLSFLSLELINQPEIQEKLQREIDAQNEFNYETISSMKYLDQCISEALRKWPPAYIITRICTKNYEIRDKDAKSAVVIEKGCLVGIPVMGIHYDPEFFPDPQRFDPERFSEENKKNIIPGTYMPFGMGPRNCIGSRFALLEMKALIAVLLKKFTFVPVEKTKLPIELSKSLALEIKGGAWIGLKPRGLIANSKRE